MRRDHGKHLSQQKNLLVLKEYLVKVENLWRRSSGRDEGLLYGRDAGRSKITFSPRELRRNCLPSCCSGTVEKKRKKERQKRKEEHSSVARIRSPSSSPGGAHDGLRASDAGKRTSLGLEEAWEKMKKNMIRRTRKTSLFKNQSPRSLGSGGSGGRKA